MRLWHLILEEPPSQAALLPLILRKASGKSARLCGSVRDKDQKKIRTFYLSARTPENSGSKAGHAIRKRGASRFA
jgi:hypothetical protein